MTRVTKEEHVKELKNKYEVLEKTNKKGQDIATINLGALDIPKDILKSNLGIPLIRKIDDQFCLVYSVQLGLNKEIKEKRLQERQELRSKKLKLKAEIKELTKQCMAAIRSKDLEKAKDLTAKIEQTESELAAI